MLEDILIPISFFATVLGFYFMRSRENLAMIEKGINPRRNHGGGPKPYAYMKYALLFIGAGTGLAVAYTLDTQFFREMYESKHDNPALYFALLAIGGGIGMFSAYKIERKHLPQTKDETPE
ncbi:MAG TPA: DUF6249 domain-containing protein [Flavipsychrobacter sp.]